MAKWPPYWEGNRHFCSTGGSIQWRIKMLKGKLWCIACEQGGGYSGKLCRESPKKTHIHCFSLTVFFSLWHLPALTNPGHFLYPQSWSSISSCQPVSVSSQLALAPTCAAAISPTSPPSQHLHHSQPGPPHTQPHRSGCRLWSVMLFPRL